MTEITLYYESTEKIFDVDFNIIPGEPAVYYYKDGSGYPGSGPEVEINKIMFEGVDVTDFFIKTDLIEDIAESILNEIY